MRLVIAQLACALLVSGVFAQRWVQLPDMNGRRVFHTATVLQNGDVLIVGGFPDHGAQLFQSETGLWAEAAADLIGERAWHSATLLDDGRVLVAGGANLSNEQITASTIIYDPGADEWREVGGMITARYGHSAFLLDSGEVLAFGGNGAQIFAEIFDPETEQWRPAQRLQHGRGLRHAAVKLNGGRVMAIGGPESPFTAEVFDPAIGSWALVAPPIVARPSGHAALALHDGRAFLTGRSPATEVYDPEEDEWVQVEDLPMVTRNFAIGLLTDGRPIVVGGMNPDNVVLRTGAIFDPGHSQWGLEAVPLLLIARRDPRLTVLRDGAVLMTGGSSTASDEGVQRTAEIFRPSTALPQVIRSFPQFVTGATNKTRILLRNSSEAADAGEIRFLSPDGNPLEVSIGGSSSSSVAFEVPSLGVLELETDGAGELVTGAVRISSSNGNASRLSAVEVFDLLGGRVSSPAPAPALRRDIFASRNARENTGLALHNPDDLATVDIELILLDGGGQELAQNQLTLLPGAQLARFLDEAELFQPFFEQNPQDFTGSIRVNASATVIVMALLQDRETGQLVAVP